jgi:uncharacterized iron-regulated membrane protein
MRVDVRIDHRDRQAQSTQDSTQAHKTTIAYALITGTLVAIAYALIAGMLVAQQAFRRWSKAQPTIRLTAAAIKTATEAKPQAHKTTIAYALIAGMLVAQQAFRRHQYLIEANSECLLHNKHSGKKHSGAACAIDHLEQQAHKTTIACALIAGMLIAQQAFWRNHRPTNPTNPTNPAQRSPARTQVVLVVLVRGLYLLYCLSWFTVCTRVVLVVLSVLGHVRLLWVIVLV